MYLITKDEDLTLNRLGRILQTFLTMDLPRLNLYWKYYKGEQPILTKTATDVGKPCNKVVINYCYSIVKNYLGYLTGKPVQYTNDDFDDVLDILKYNDYVDEDSELLRQALIYGVSYEINYLDEEGKQRFKCLDTRECIPIYYNNLNNDLAYVVRFYEEDVLDLANTNYIVEVYGNLSTKYYRSVPGFNSFQLIEELPNFYNLVPITVFRLNKDEEPIFNQIISLQDSYNNLFSGAIDDFEAFADAYLILKGVTANEEDLVAMKTNRVLMMDSDSAAEYLTKNVSDTALQNILDKANEHIHTISNSPDFNDEKFMALSGIAMRYKLVGFETVASSIENAMVKALTKRIELICSVLSKVSGESEWRDVNITFTRNLPLSLDPTSPTELMQYKGTVSDETILRLIPFVDDVDEEMKKVEALKLTNMELYSTAGDTFNTEEDDE